jgi:hypothetical protein
MKMIPLAAAAALSAVLPISQAKAWMHGGGSWGGAGRGYAHSGDAGGWEHSTTVGAGGVSHSGNYGGYEHGTQAGPGGVAHESNAGGYWHGGAATSSGGYAHASDYGGYYHSTAAGPYGAEHTGAYGRAATTVPYGNYYHQPAVANYYGARCYNCGGGSWGAPPGAAVATGAIGFAAGAVTGAAVANAAAPAAPAYPVGAAYAALPGGCAYRPLAREYDCGAMWLAPAYGANGLYYSVVPAP